MDGAELKRTTLSVAKHAFVVCNGEELRDIYELVSCLERLGSNEFSHHVGNDRNHFAVWIRDVLGNEALAHDLDYQVNLDDPDHYVETLKNHIRWLESI